MVIDRSLLLHFIIWMWINTTVWVVGASYIDYSENTQLIQQRTGNDIKLSCGITGLVSKGPIGGMQFNWYFKPCGDNSYQKPCHAVRFEKWSHISCNKNSCQSQLHLRNLTDKSSGLYKCTIYPYKLDDVTTLDIQLVRTYQLDVKNSTALAPEFLDSFPENKTVTIGSQVVFQCRVQSSVHPTIRWFKRIPDMPMGMEYGLGQENFNSHIIQYNGGIYELLQTAREKIVDDEIYLSKLILNGVQSQDEGFYACVAISYKGHRIREALLRVEDNMDYQGDASNYWDDYDVADERQQSDNFWMFFFMPLGLAIIPLSIWLCYILSKKMSNDRMGLEDEEQTLQ